MLSVRLALLAATLLTSRGEPIRVDLNPPGNDRTDILSRGWQNWAVSDESPTRTFDTITVTLRSPAGFAPRWHKPLLADGVTMASDGVASPNVLEMVLTGLAPGTHTLATYHNHLTEGDPGRFEVRVEGASAIATVEPTIRARDDSRAACAFLEFTAGDGPVTIRFRADSDREDRDIVLNGFEIDGPDPRSKAIHPFPPHDDEHADGDSGALELRWNAPDSAVTHDLYFGTSRSAVAAAGRGSAAYRGNQNETGHVVEGLAYAESYYWRIDTVDVDGAVTPGDVWHFRIRHLAFPGAEGYGRFAQGGRGGRVIAVTNLDDSGPGSLRAAVEAEGPRTVVFHVSGVIDLQSKLVVRNPYLTIAGQTAPGDGICLRNYTFGLLGTHDVIIRYIRQRMGDRAGLTMDGSGAAWSDHAIFDHCSISWSIDEGFSSRGARNITLQRSIIAEALNLAGHSHYVGSGKGHSFAASISGRVGSFHHNLLVHNAGRNWSLAGGYDNAGRYDGVLDIRNNVVYNWHHRTTDGGVKRLNLVNNYYKPGPATRMFDLLKFDGGRPEDPQAYHVRGNVLEGVFGADDPGQGVVLRPEHRRNIFLTEAPVVPPHVTTQSAEDAYASVLADVGCNLPAQDPMDRRLIREVIDGTTTFIGGRSGLPGIIDSQADSGGWPDYPAVRRPEGFDTDGDGMPDAWERERGLDPEDPRDGNADPDCDGYSNLEDYLNQLAAGPLP